MNNKLNMSKRISPIHGPKSNKGIKVQGESKKKQGHVEGKAWEADRRIKQFDTRDRGPGSAFGMAFLREEAQRVKAEKKVPGALGYKVPVDTSHWTNRTVLKKGKYSKEGK